MSSEVITYARIREIQRDERTKTTLTRMQDNMVELLQIYLREKNSLLEKNKDNKNLFSRDLYSRVEYELKNAIKGIANIFEIREKKIMDKAFHTAKTDVKIKDTSNMLPFEKQLFNQLVTQFNSYNSDCILNILKNNKPVFKSSKIEEKVLKREEAFSNKLLVRILSDIPALLWENDTTIGPYKNEDVVFLPKKVGMLLIKQNKAQEIKK